jgi:hypothetical protein
MTLRKAADDQVCNLCRAEATLSWDHVPPRACGNDVPVNVSRLFEPLYVIQRPSSRSYNGLRYETLCVPCNGGLSRFDHAFGELVRQIKVQLRKMNRASGVAAVQAKPAAVLRSVLSHILAAKRTTDNVSLDAAVRSYLDGGQLDSAIRLYFWPYPFYETVVARDFTFVDHVNGYSLNGIGSVMKFFPLAFMLTDASSQLSFDRLDQYAALSLDETADVSINFDMVMDPAWPERPDRMRSVAGGAAFAEAVSSLEGRFGMRLAAHHKPAEDSETAEDSEESASDGSQAGPSTIQ